MNDSIERIKEDAIKPFYQYWNCATADDCMNCCISCNSKIDGKRPSEHYKTGCPYAMNLDLIDRTVEVMNGSVERTCHMKLLKHGATYDVFYFDCCDNEYAENRNDNYASVISGDVCPYCGAKVVE